jgi:hypothetical protein
MDGLIKSMISFSWAMSLFGVEQLVNAVTPRDPSRPVDEATGAFYSVTSATEKQFDDLATEAFESGDRLQRGMLDLAYSVLTFDALTARRMMMVTFEVMQVLAETLKFFMPGQDSRAAWQEFKNKLQTFNLFEHADSLLNIPRDGGLSLPELVKRAYLLEPYLAVWVTEGLGHYYAECIWEQDGKPRGLLKNAQSGRLSTQSMIALHAGMGLSFANHVLESVKPKSNSSEIRKALEEFVMLCRINSRKGYAEAAIEAVGLVVRNLYPQMLYAVDEQFSAIDQGLVGYFWHGVGRAIYFAPRNFVPCGNSAWRAVEMCESESPHELGRLNALAGLAWAMMLVNIRHPEIIEMLIKNHGDRLSQDAFSNGVISSAIVWRDSTGGDSYLDRICQHQPCSSDSQLVGLWDKLVKRPCEEALQDYYAVLKRHDCLGELFRYQFVPELIARLESEPVGAGYGTEQRGAARHRHELAEG